MSWEELAIIALSIIATTLHFRLLLGEFLPKDVFRLPRVSRRWKECCLSGDIFRRQLILHFSRCKIDDSGASAVAARMPSRLTHLNLDFAKCKTTTRNPLPL